MSRPESPGQSPSQPPSQPPGHPSSQLPEPSIQPSSGWHCTHQYYRFNRGALSQLSPQQIAEGVAQVSQILTLEQTESPLRLQTFIVSGHKADFGWMALDPDPLKIDRIHQRIMASSIGVALESTYSFISLTEISEYVSTPDQYRRRLIDEGEPPDSPRLAAKVDAYERRLPAMNVQRLTPELPAWPAVCFYPMNKQRAVGANWFTTPFSLRNAMMAEHAQSGMTFAGRVTQVVTVSVGMDDWEWGVTLWARCPDYLKDIVYRMRFDEASAKYGEFGQFFVGYQASFPEIAKHCCVAE
jgi:hydrogen peroxide-dependent heme synthase